MELQLKSLFYCFCIVIVSVYSEATLISQTATTPTLTGLPATTSTLCDKDLIVERSSYDKNSFLLYMEVRERGWSHPEPYLALRNSDGLNWTMELHDSHEFSLDFTLLDKCLGKWEISTINFRTQFASVVQLLFDFIVIESWTLENYTDLHQVSTAIQKTLDKDWFSLVFNSDQGELVIADLYIELHCNCTHVPTLPSKTATMPTWTETSTSTVPKHTATGLSVTTSKLCDKSLFMELSSYENKSFDLSIGIVEDRKYIYFHDAYLALRNSNGLNWTMEALDGQSFDMDFFQLENCSDKWEISTINFRTKLASEVQLIIGGSVQKRWIFDNNLDLHQVSDVIQQTLDADSFRLVFKAGQGTLLIADVYIELFCNCTHVTALPPKTATLSRWTVVP